MLVYRRSVIFAIICAGSALSASCFETPGTCDSDADCFAGEVCQDGVCRIPPETGSPTDTTPPPDTNRVDSSDTATVDTTDPADSADTTDAVDTATDPMDTGPACMVDRDCGGSQRCCSNECVDIDTNSSHCGGCSEACSASESCVEGSCEPDSCTADARCPADSDTVECVDGDCRAQTCTGSKHPCDGGRRCCEWSTFGTAATPGYRTHIDLEYDENDRRLLAYWNELNGESSKRIVELAESAAGPPMWSISKISETQPAGLGVSLAIDSGNNPHLIYKRTNGDGTDELRWARRGSSGWTRSSPISPVTAPNWALTVDSSDTPHAVFRRGSDAVYGTGTDNWNVRKLGTINSKGIPEGLAVDSTGLPHLVYRDDNDKVVYTWKAPAAGWQSEDLHTQEQPFHADLELNAPSRPEVAFDEAGSDNVFFAEKDSNGSWQVTKLTDDGEHARLVIDADGTRRVYFLSSVSGTKKHTIEEARRIDGNWQIKTLRTVSDILTGTELDVALNSAGRPGIVYTLDDKIKFMEW